MRAQRQKRDVPIAERRRRQIGLRLGDTRHNELVARAADRGTTVTAEADGLIDKALVLEKLLGADMIGAIHQFHVAGKTEADSRGIEGDWTRDPDCYRRGLFSAIQYLLEQAPEPWDPEAMRLYLLQAVTSVDARRAQGLARRRNVE
jgi:hypothetical protein